MYGSQVYGNPTEYSDIDIAVIFDGYDGDEWKTSSRLCLFAWNIDKSIEPILLDLKYDRSGFAEEIMKVGIEL
ncbi:MAG: nucleotidyltransferase domain-containing protein [Clostridiales bacterium]|nr:nucleotidyltransferase domain-containing protein [Clostridiales bacterium]